MMFCVQCEQTIRTRQAMAALTHKACAARRRKPRICRDVLIYTLQGLSAWALAAREHGMIDSEIDAFVPKAFFATLTNVNFDSARIVAYVNQALAYRRQLAAKLAPLAVQADTLPAAASFEPGADLLAQLAQAPQTAVNRGKNEVNEDIMGLRLLCLYGLKGAAASWNTPGCWISRMPGGRRIPSHHMSWLGTDPSDLDPLFQCAMDIGLLNFKIMEMLIR